MPLQCQFPPTDGDAPGIIPAEFAGIDDEIRERGFAFRPGDAMHAAMGAYGMGADWPSFASSWDDLGLDLYMADGGRYRRRRFAAFRVGADGIRRKPHQPHYQSRDYNLLNGGIERWFEPVLEQNANHSFMREMMGICGWVFDSVAPNSARSSPWHAEMHQFRIEARAEESGLPTPEGMHRDGVDWVCVMLVNRENVLSGVTEIVDQSSGTSSKFTLTNPLDTVFLDDLRVKHGVTPITPLDSDREGYRDVLVLTFRHEAP